jgi:hypothetical protein
MNKLIVGVCLATAAAIAPLSPGWSGDPVAGPVSLAALTDDDAPRQTPRTDRIEVAEWCFLTGEQTSGLNKICLFNCPSGGAATTVKSHQICPAKFRR